MSNSGLRPAVPEDNECNNYNYENQLRNPLCGASRGCEKLRHGASAPRFPDRKGIHGRRGQHGLLDVRPHGRRRRHACRRDAPPRSHRPAEGSVLPHAPRNGHLQRRRPRRGEGRRRRVRTRLQGGPLPRFGRPRGDLREQGRRESRQILFQLADRTPQLPKPTPWWPTWVRSKGRTTATSTRCS